MSKYLNIRSGLSSAFASLSSGPRRIGYLGASVMAQKNGYRDSLHNWICERTGHQHLQANAALGANGSICSVFVMDELVVQHEPALCFVECSLVDMAPTTPPSKIAPVLEGIILKLKAIGCEVCLLHLYRADRLYADNAVIAAQEEVAAHYGVPSINLGLEMEEERNLGSISPATLFADSVHLTQVGARYVSARLMEDIDILFQAGGKQLLKPMRLCSEDYSRAKLVYCKADMVIGATGIRKRFRHFYPYFEVGPNSEIRFSSESDLIGLLMVVGPESGLVEVRQGGCSREYQLLDEWCSVERIQSLVFQPFMSKGEQVQIRRIPERAVTLTANSIHSAVPPEANFKLIGFLLRQ